MYELHKTWCADTLLSNSVIVWLLKAKNWSNAEEIGIVTILGLCTVCPLNVCFKTDSSKIKC